MRISYFCAEPHTRFKNMKLKLQFSVLLLTVFFSFSNVEKANAQGFGDFTVYPCADSAAVVALIDTVFLKSVPVYAKQNIKFYGDPSSVGYFKNGYFLGFTKGQGIIMTSGKSDDVDKENVCGSAANASTNNNGVEMMPTSINWETERLLMMFVLSNFNLSPPPIVQHSNMFSLPKNIMIMFLPVLMMFLASFFQGLVLMVPSA